VKRYRFRLDAILRLRVAEEEQARTVLGRAERELHVALAARDAELARYRSLLPARGPIANDIFHRQEVVARMAAATLRVAEHQVAVVAERAARARLMWSEAARRVAILERLDERRRAEYQEEERRAEVALVDDIVTARYVADGIERHRDAQGVLG
jgi:flagellar export protein FliJ